MKNWKYEIAWYIPKFSQSLKMCNFHWKIQKFKKTFFIMLISFSINFKQKKKIVFHTFFAISHLFFSPFPTFFVTARLLNYTNQLKKKLSLYLLRFSNFAWVQDLWHHTDGRTDGRTDARTDELLDHNTLSRPKGPQAKTKKVWKLLIFYDSFNKLEKLISNSKV